MASTSVRCLQATPDGSLWIGYWHLGEKEHWGKGTGWQRSTRVRLLIAPPRSGATATFPRGVTWAAPVGLIDLYPTLIDVCGLAARPGLAGESLVPLLRSPATTSDRHILTIFDAGNFSVSGPRWRYLRYADGNEELYDSANDPHEWTNLAGRSELVAIQQAMAARIPVITASTTDASAPPRGRPQKEKGRVVNKAVATPPAHNQRWREAVPCVGPRIHLQTVPSARATP